MLDGDQGEVECGCVGWVSECRARGSKGLRGRGEERRGEYQLCVEYARAREKCVCACLCAFV